MKILLGCNNKYGAVQIEIGKFLYRSAEVLGNINRSAVFTQQNLFAYIKFGKIDNNIARIIFPQNTIFKPLKYYIPPFLIGVALIINFFKFATKAFIRLIESFIHPRIHCFPECNHVFIALFPFLQHFLRFVNQLWVISCFFFKHHIIIADKMVAFFTDL